MKPLMIGKKRLSIPVFQGGMGIGISLGGLAGAVAAEGGVGMISAAQIGFREADFSEHPLEANLRAMQKEYQKARKLAPDGVIGFNIMTAMRHYEEYVGEAVRLGADLIVSGAGLPMDLPKLAAGSSCSLAPIVSTEKSAAVILRYWEKKYRRLPDIVIIEGPEAGGHLGFHEEQLAEFDTTEKYDREISRIIKMVQEYGEKYGKQIPVVVGGGVNDHQRVQELFKLGADAVQTASRFVTTEECDADIRFKEAYLCAEKEDVILIQSPVGMKGRAIRNEFAKKVQSGQKIPHGPCLGCLKKCRPAEIPYCITEALINAANGRTEDGLIFCGAGVYRAKRIETVKEVLHSLLPEIKKV